MADVSMPPVSQNPAVRSSRFWMPFGDLVLQADATQFKINRDILARQSEVFRDMFSVAVPGAEGDTQVEGCPLVAVSDKVADWENLLELLYNPILLMKPPSIQLVAAMLRLGYKYEMTQFKADALSRLHHEFPTTLQAWDGVAEEMTKMADEANSILYLLLLAYELGIHTSIPALAFQTLNTMTLQEIFSDTLPLNDSFPTYIVVPTNIKHALALASERLHRHRRDAFSWLDDEDVLPTDDCEQWTVCRRAAQSLLIDILSEQEHDLRYRFLRPWGGYLAAVGPLFRKSWDALPSFFDLPKWDELRDE
ncbi:BTB domain-containing protein [Mycena kentingensis (nom. inval.)]|nr:BTB domain-containing protein [Mycena kentingensis (nom. inval.)]